MIFKDGKTFSAYVRSKLHSGYITIDVIDNSPFFVRPFPIHEEDKPVMDRYMAKLVSLGILS